MPTPVFRAEVDEGDLVWSDSRVWAYLRTLEGREVDVIIKVHRREMGTQAKRYYFGVVVALIADHCGYERDEMHELLAMRFLRIEDDPVTGSPRRRHLPEFDSKDGADYIDRCIRFAAELGVYVPSPGEVVA